MLFSTKPSNRTTHTTTNNTLLGHPKGLFVLFITEMWERFSFYGLRAILVLFLVDRLHGGFGWSEGASLQVYGIWLMMAYLSTIPGGFLADYYIGQRVAVLWGAGLQCLGYMLLALKNASLLMPALGFISLGTGLLKPNISSIVGELYKRGDSRREHGFTIFYMGISVGMMLASFVIGTVGEVYGWEYGFALAGAGSLLSMLTFWGGKKHLPNPVIKSHATAPNQVSVQRFTFAQEEKDHLRLILVCLIAFGIFFMALEQSGGLMTLYAEKYTNRYIFGWELPASLFTGLSPAFVVLLGPLISFIWGRLGKRFYDINATFKMGVGNIITGLGFLCMVGAALQKQASLTGQSSPNWLFAAYFIYAIGELCIVPVSLSFITKVAPRQFKAVMTGVYFATAGLASFLAGKLGEQAALLGNLGIFVLIAATTSLVGLLLIAFNRRLATLMHDSIQEVESAGEG